MKIENSSSGGWKQWLTLAFTVILPFVGLWAIDTKYSPTLDPIRIGSLGFTLSAAGFLLSVAGFSFTIWQLQKTQGATQAVASTVVKLRNDFGSLDVISELRAARAAAVEARAYLSRLNRPNKAAALVRYDLIRECLNKSIAVPSQMTDIDIDEIKNHIGSVHGACTILDPSQPTDTVLDAASMATHLRELEDFLVLIEHKIKGSFGD